MTHIFMHEIHELLYILVACLMFMLVTPRALVGEFRRKLLYVTILIVFSAVYLGFESIDVRVYALHVMPIAIVLAAVFEGALVGMVTWLAFVCCGIAFVGTDWVANASSNTILMLLGLYFHHRFYRRSSLGIIMAGALSLVAFHAAVYLFVCAIRGNAMDAGTAAMILIGTLPSAAIVFYSHYRVKNHARMMEELYNAEKYQMLGQLAASISHEVRNPLTMTSGFLQMMGKQSLSADTLERYRKHAIEGIDQATSIITDYLNYAKPSVEEARPIDVKTELESLTPWIAPLADMSNVEIEMKHHDDCPLIILGEPKKFQQCLLNLLKNAIEAMPGGGKLSIATRVEQHQVCIAIADTGVGMSKLQLKRIGTPFFTTKEKGTGLGLMVVVSLISVMGGKIAFTSKRGQGTVCEIRYRLSNAIPLQAHSSVPMELNS
ncbi:sensor histidine kinase [Paenibacillus sacheonensis]|uniref:histidine kinase n=1 Tax=Paenibacillus sacheonensis TaxID=742054 RepID=A0A7X4YNR0_9BACL|nr:HAMP domain-containing sensor histidine kinase [Paenibacillus sacheonensis]MBM7565372.1 two-component system sporulation sensor kinase B [Paenibacillus sacheonensis]NBC69700.1 sensor histidine kinase [Paenibacillus sacheonensis]